VEHKPKVKLEIECYSGQKADEGPCASPKSRMNRLRFPVTTFKGWDWPESVASYGFRPGLLAVSRAESQCARRYSWP